MVHSKQIKFYDTRYSSVLRPPYIGTKQIVEACKHLFYDAKLL